jgi:hypothetical protein
LSFCSICCKDLPKFSGFIPLVQRVLNLQVRSRPVLWPAGRPGCQGKGVGPAYLSVIIDEVLFDLRPSGLRVAILLKKGLV